MFIFYETYLRGIQTLIITRKAANQVTKVIKPFLNIAMDFLDVTSKTRLQYITGDKLCRSILICRLHCNQEGG